MMVALALGLEWFVGDPRSPHHPVARFGMYAHWVERRLYRDDCARGVLAWCLALLPVLFLLGFSLRLAGAMSPWFETALGAGAVWSAIGWRSLLQHVADVRDATDLGVARERVSRIVGREVDALDAAGVRSAALESLAENASDSVVAPLFWVAVGGPLAAVAYRGVNTLDAMWGHRSPRFQNFGWMSARTDDLVNWFPARACALAFACAGGNSALWKIRDDARGHPSVNAGWPESAMAHALGVRLGGPVRRGAGVEVRPPLGPQGADAPSADDLGRGLRLTNGVLLAFGTIALLWEFPWW